LGAVCWFVAFTFGWLSLFWLLTFVCVVLYDVLTPTGLGRLAMQNSTVIIQGQADGSWHVEDRTANVILAKFGPSDFWNARMYVDRLKA